MYEIKRQKEIEQKTINKKIFENDNLSSKNTNEKQNIPINPNHFYPIDILDILYSKNESKAQDNKLIVSSSKDCIIKIWSADSGVVVREIGKDSSNVQSCGKCVAITLDRKNILSCGKLSSI